MSSPYPESPRSALKFAKLFPDNESCIEYLAQWRWPDGFRCPRCEGVRATRSPQKLQSSGPSPPLDALIQAIDGRSLGG